MAIRVTQNIMYTTQVNNMNSVLNKLYDSSVQSNGLRINKPSDDPLGAGRVMQSRVSLSSMAKYQDNISTATGWLSELDGLLSSEGGVQQLLTRAKELATQGATGTYDGTNREQMSYEIREIYYELLDRANSSYGGSYVFSGQKTDTQAYAETLGVTVKDAGTHDDLSGVTLLAEGAADYTVVIQALETGLSQDVAANGNFRYSKDGGATWEECTFTDSYPDSDHIRIEAGGASVIMPKNLYVNEVDTETESSSDNGTWLYIRPTAIYQGDDKDTQVVVPYGSTVIADASGYFTKDVTVRIDDNDGTNITFSYTTDNGVTWTQKTTSATASTLKLPVEGGYLELDGQPAAGEQYVIHPHRAEITLRISDTSEIALNLVGKDVFGGVYTNPATGETEVVNNGGNIFEIMGELIRAAETNDQDAMGECVARLTDAMNVVLTSAAVVGGRENRLTATSAALTLRKYSETDRLSSIEDVDLTELMTRISQQQTAYSAVLQSASIIMQQSLLNYL